MDRILVGTTLAAVLVSTGWFGWWLPSQPSHRRPGAYVGATRVEAASDESRGAKDAPSQWLMPSAQPRGPEWVYDLFTPPAVRLDAETGKWVAVPVEAAHGVPRPLAGTELMAVTREPFRLQLVGYVGGSEGFRGVFEDRQSADVILAGPGGIVPALNLEVSDFVVRQEPVRLEDGTMSTQRVARATVLERSSGLRTTLRAGETRLTDALRAVISTVSDDEKIVIRSGPGEEFESADQTYRIAKLHLDPPSAELMPTTGSGQTIHLDATDPDSAEVKVKSAQPPP